MDPIQHIFTSARGRRIASLAGVAPPPVLRRFSPGQPLLTGPALLGAAPGGRVAVAAGQALKDAGCEVVTAAPTMAVPAAADTWGALVFDASGITDVAGLAALHDFFPRPLRALARSGRVIVLGTQPELTGSPGERIAQRVLEGFTRSLGKELRGGATANLVLVAPGAQDRLAATLRFLASARSAFVDGQVVRIDSSVAGPAVVADPERPLDGCGVVVTGAARGIGAAMVRVLARDGAHVLGVDVAALAGDLRAVMAETGGEALVTDVTVAAAPARIAAAARHGLGGLHGIVHNAGITRDRKLVNLDAAAWRQVLEVNLAAPARITDELVAGATLTAGGRVVAVSSIAGIAGNVGQTNYAASKAGVIGMVDALAPALAEQGITINAVAPGFIETQMTQRVPLVTREGGRRLSSLRQGGLPQDVAETVGWLLSPRSTGVTGNVVRVCGQGLIGA